MLLRLVATQAVGVAVCLAAPNADRAKAVKEAFQFSWDGYYKYTFPQDDLQPVTNTSGNSRNGWGAGAVDALSTALIMDLPKVVDVILAHIATIDYTVTDQSVSVFETTIRYLGGMLSGYDLLNGPLSSMPISRHLVPTLLEQAKVLADKLAFAFNTPSGVPYNMMWFTNDSAEAGQRTNNIAQFGTMVLEWTRLSDLVGDNKYADLTQKAESYMLDPQPPEMVFRPGLLGSDVDLETGKFVNANGGFGGGTDSFYEYLMKMYVYDPVRFGEYKDRWILAADSAMADLQYHPADGQTWLAGYDNESAIVKQSGHLNCFMGGSYILGGLQLNRRNYVDFGLELNRGCHATYSATATKIGPEAWSWDADNVPAAQKDFFDQNGFWIPSWGKYYILRPEVIESWYYAYRATGDSIYQEWAWDAFQAINTACRVGSGFSSLRDVNVAPQDNDGTNYSDEQQSFWFAETLKYLYMFFAEDADWQLASDNSNKFVFNTEAHPVMVFGAKYGASGASAGLSGALPLVVAAVSGWLYTS